MKQSFNITVLLVAFLFAAATPILAQSSTEGKEFWVALTLGRDPEDKIVDFEAYICVSSKTRKGTVTVTNPIDGWTNTYTIPAGTGWLEIKDIPWEKWFPSQQKSLQQFSGQIKNLGLKVECSEEMSVFAALRYEFAFDATNVLPITALQYDYIIQDYPPYANNTPTTSFSTFTVLATEDNTQVEITPTNTTYDNKPANVPYTVTLNKGQVYYVVSKEGSATDAAAVSLSGTTVKSKNNKKIAVFNGNICGRIPNQQSGRDICYEQAMPIDYWGNEFIITRAYEKDANRFRITALEDNTAVNINGYYFTSLNAHETYEIELAVANDMDKYELGPQNQIIADAAYIQTSCPCAIYNYETGGSYDSKGSTQIISEWEGDPSMTWVSPLEQKINEITFGTMNTTKTKRHFVNIVIETANIATMSLQEVAAGQYSLNMLSPADFIPVAGTKYSYARKPLTIDRSTTYRLKSDKGGFIAYVYGNGSTEGYAYSVGSSAVKRGVQVDGITYTDGYRSDEVYCVKSQLSFDAQVGTDVIDKVDWDFGDGISEKDGTPQTTHTYDSPGWYDVTANIYAHKECPETQYPAEEIKFSFYVRRPDTVDVTVIGDCKSWDYVGPLVETKEQAPNDCATENYERQTIVHGQDTRDVLDTTITAHDSVFIKEEQKWYYFSSFPQGIGVVQGETTTINASGCTHIHSYRYDLTILTCLEMDIPNNPEQRYVCPDADQKILEIPFNYVKGQVGESHLLFGTHNIELTPVVTMTDAYFEVPTESLVPGNYAAKIVVNDPICGLTFTYDYQLLVYYPSNIFKIKFGNVLAVYLSDFNGGYEFTAYQWYKDGMPIDGATSSIYHSDAPFPEGAEYFVVLTRKDGLVLPSCSQTIPITTQDNGSAQTPAAQKIIQNRRLYILLDGNLYDVYGNRVQ